MKERALFVDLVNTLRTNGLSLCAAESCTGGWFAKSVVDVPGASTVFCGGVVSYQNEIKEAVLHVPHDLLARYTAVSAPVACAMAEGVRALMGADIGVSVTGLAGPGGGTQAIPVGRVFVGLSRAGQETACLSLTLAGTRDEIRAKAVEEMAKAILTRIV